MLDLAGKTLRASFFHAPIRGEIDFIEDALGFLVVGPGNIFTDSLVNLQSKFDIKGRVEKQAEGS